jgi:lysophospholipase L1-like esterase
MIRKILIFLILIPVLGCSKNEGLETIVLKIHPVGNSITRGKAGDTYRHYLKSKIEVQLKVDVDFVGSCPHAPDSKADWTSYPDMVDSLDNDLEHDGWGGIKIHEITNSYGNTRSYPEFKIEELVTTYPSDIILLMIGTNDIYFNYEVEKAPAKLDTLIKKIINSSAAHLIVSSIPPTNKTDINSRISTYNTRMYSIVESYRLKGENITFIDIHKNMDGSDLLSDGVHPNSSGNRKIAEGYFEAIESGLTGINERAGTTQFPQKFRISQNFPNPFNSYTTINIYLAEAAFVSLKIFNSLGQEIKTGISDNINAGNLTYKLNVNNLASGTYFYKFEAGDYSVVKKLLLAK